MWRLNHEQGQLFYSFCLEEAVPDDHPVRRIAAVLDLSWVHSELAPYYPRIGRPSIDPVLMIRMLIIGYVFAIRSGPRCSRCSNALPTPRNCPYSYMAIPATATSTSPGSASRTSSFPRPTLSSAAKDSMLPA